jgi:hypothetical protein
LRFLPGASEAIAPSIHTILLFKLSVDLTHDQLLERSSYFVGVADEALGTSDSFTFLQVIWAEIPDESLRAEVRARAFQLVSTTNQLNDTIRETITKLDTQSAIIEEETAKFEARAVRIISGSIGERYIPARTVVDRPDVLQGFVNRLTIDRHTLAGAFHRRLQQYTIRTIDRVVDIPA